MNFEPLIAGRYRLQSAIGAGGMDTLWLGHDTRLSRDVTVKLLHPSLDLPRDHFEREAARLTRLQGPAFPEVYDFGESFNGDEPVLYLVTERIRGTTLEERLRQAGPAPQDQVMTFIAEIAEALGIAHSKGIVHGDIKPSNIVIDPDGPVRLFDFGITRTMRTLVTSIDIAVAGTPSYMSPEQIRGDQVTGSSDLYALGAVGFECLSGHPPFQNPEIFAILRSHLKDPPPALPERIRPAVSQVIMTALAKAPEDRWATGEAFAIACRAAISGWGERQVPQSMPAAETATPWSREVAAPLWRRRERRLLADASPERRRRNPVERAELDVAIWLADGANHEQIERALTALLAETGLKVTDRGRPELGSWFRRLEARARRTARHLSEDRIVAEVERKIRLEVFDKAQAAVDHQQSTGAAALIAALQTEHEACIQVGSLLLLKADGKVAVRNLTQFELARLERNPTLLRDPASILEKLQELAHTERELE